VAPGPQPVSLDTSRLPRGERAARALIEAVAASDDRVEHHYLEIKGPLDLAAKKDQSKVAKFILGAGNRMPETAAAAFEGYGVMVVGVSPSAIVGVPPVEVLDIDKAVRPFIGADGPRWDILQVPIADSVNVVLLVLVDPPVSGQRPFVCRKTGGDGLRDGAVYIRGNGDTRDARSDELLLLMRRGEAKPVPKLAFEVSVAGAAVPISLDEDATVEAYIATERARLLGALSRSEPGPVESKLRRDVADRGAALSLSDGQEVGARQFRTVHAEKRVMVLGYRRREFLNMRNLSPFNVELEHRREGDYRYAIDEWERKFRAAWPKAVEGGIGERLHAVVPKIENLEEVFLYDVQIVVRLEGGVRGIENRMSGYAGVFSTYYLPRPPRTWGPRRRETAPLTSSTSLPAPAKTESAVNRSQSMRWDSAESVTITLNISELRPRQVFEWDDSDLVLMVHDVSQAPVRGTWEITARGHNRIYRGGIVVHVGAPLDMTPLLRDALAHTAAEAAVNDELMREIQRDWLPTREIS
jgi:hypothetical protein